ncbi:MAG: tyrosine-protein phosphatase [Flammeovirgaceae bacterium]
MLGLFKKKRKAKLSFEGLDLVKVDMHSHLLPGIDDGAKTIEESLALIQRLVELGFTKLIMTPHIMSDFYRNTPEIILEKLDLVKQACQAEGIEVELEAAAEYYLDEGFIKKLDNQEKLLTFGDQYLLFETSYLNAPHQLDSAIFMMQSQGYKPVMAHPERYVYNFGKIDKFVEYHEKGVLMQVNLMSVLGYYGPPQKRMADELIEKGIVSFIASDCHKDRHLDAFGNALQSKQYHTMLQQGLLNNQLLS